MPDNNVKPGWKTTEFWTQAIGTIGGIVAASGALPGGQIVQIIGGVSALFNTIAYLWSRTSIKNAASTAAASSAPPSATSK